MQMFDFGALAANVLDSIDNVAKETLEEPKRQSATSIRQQRNQSAAELVDSAELMNEGNDTSSAILKIVSSNQLIDEPNQSPLTNEPIGDDLERRKLLIKKNKEIERLNSECLDLEDQCSSLKKEVKDAWDNFKVAQEKAIFRESELQDDLKQLQKARQVDKQQLLQELLSLRGELDDASNRLVQVTADRDTVKNLLSNMSTLEADWCSREEVLQSELKEARLGTMQGVQGLKEELANALQNNEMMRQEQAELLRHRESRMNELEAVNAELTAGLADKQKEVQRLKVALDASGKNESTARLLEGMHLQVDEAVAQLDSERDRLTTLERRNRQLEVELRAAQLSHENSTQQAADTIAALNSQIAAQEDRWRASSSYETSKAKQDNNSPIVRRLFGLELDSNMPDQFNSSEARTDQQPEQDSAAQDHIASLNSQIQSLSQQLLKKQSQVMDLQAESSAVKSRLLDCQARCSHAEKQLHVLDLEEGMEESEDMQSYSRVSSNKSTGIGRRRAAGTLGSGGKVTMGLEQLGVRAGPRVNQAVETLDSWTLLIGRFLRGYPLARLGFVVYLLMLHLWALVILALHTHSLD